MDYDQLPDGNVYVAYDDEDYVPIASEAYLSTVLDTVGALAASW